MKLFKNLYNQNIFQVGSIITTSALSLDVSCTFADSLTVDIDDVSIEQDSFVMEEETDSGDVSFLPLRVESAKFHITYCILL